MNPVVQKKRSRLVLTIVAATALGAAMAYAFWPRPMMVDIGEVTRGPMVVTIDEEGRTRVRDAYIVSTPVAGRLLRVATGSSGTRRLSRRCCRATHRRWTSEPESRLGPPLWLPKRRCG